MTIGKEKSDEDVVQEISSSIKQSNRQTLFDFLDRREKTKILIWDKDLLKHFSLIAKFKDLQEHGVTKMFTLQKSQKLYLDHQDQLSEKIDHVIYFCQPDLSKMELVIDNLRINAIHKPTKQQQMPACQFHLTFIPKSSTFCENKLKENDVIDRFTTISELPVYLFSYDHDVLSLQNDRAFYDCVIQNDSCALYDVAMCLYQFELIFGSFGEIFYKGDLAQQVYQQLAKIRQARKSKNSPAHPDHCESDPQIINNEFLIDRLIIFDRNVDLITPFVTQLTYEGLIDEIFSIKNGQCEFPADKFQPLDSSGGGSGDEQSATSAIPSTSGTGPQHSEKKEILLTSADDVYSELRNLNFNAVGAALSKRVKSLAELQQQIQSATTVRECKEFVKRIPQLRLDKQSVGNHMTVAELVKERCKSTSFLDTVACEQEILNLIDVDRIIPFIEEQITKGENLHKVIRLMCLQSLVSDGLKKKIFDQYRKEFLQAFGYNYVSLLVNLQKGDLFKLHNSGSTKKHDSKSSTTPSDFNYDSIRKHFRLIADEVNEQNPNDIAYVYSGFAPLLVRLCQYLQKSGPDSGLELLKRLPCASGVDQNSDYSRNVMKKINDKKISLVVFVGGVTFAEISALRFLSSLDESHAFLILTTSLINGSSVIDGINTAK